MSDDSKTKDEPKPNGSEKGLAHFEITTDGKGGWDLVNGNKSKLSPKQRAWCEALARLGAARGESGRVSYGSSAKSLEEKYSSFSIKGFGRRIKDVKAFDSKGNVSPLSLQETGDVLRLYGEKTLAKGSFRDLKGITKPLFQMAEDVYKFGKMVAQGKTKDAVGKAANKIYANLKGLIGLESENESKLYGINKIASRSVGRVLEPYKQIGRNFKDLFNRLSGRGERAPAKVRSSSGHMPVRGREGGGR